MPFNTKFRLDLVRCGWDVKIMDLAERFTAYVDVTLKDEKSVIGMHPFGEDALIVARKIK